MARPEAAAPAVLAARELAELAEQAPAEPEQPHQAQVELARPRPGRLALPTLLV